MKKQAIKSLNHCAYSIRYHLVLVTKYRRAALTADILDKLKYLVGERLEEWGGELFEFNGESDHIHILCDIPPKCAIADFVNALKTGTSRRIRNEFQEHLKQFYAKPVLWSRSYCVVSCGSAPVEIVKQYIQNQNTQRA